MADSMDIARENAERAVPADWGEQVRFVVIDAPPTRPGRGRSASPPKGRRLADRQVQLLCEETTSRVVHGLRTGSLSPATARTLVRDTGFEESIRVAETRREAVEAFAEFFGLGFWLWTLQKESDDPEPGVFRAIFAFRRQLT